MRYVAYKIHPQEFVENEIFEKSLILDGKRIHRVRLLGNVTNVDKSNIVSFNLDGISVKDFENKSLDVEENDLLDIIGRIGEYNGERYVALEIYGKKIMKKIIGSNLEIWKLKKQENT